MEKVGIITFYGHTNYGNRLQTFAVQTILEDRGFIADTLVWVNNLLGWHTFTIRQYLKGNDKASRIRHFWKFNKKYIRTKLYSGVGKKIPSKFISEYSYFVTGSDQVWNVKMNRKEENNNLYFLSFAEDKKKVCISPSIGINTIPEEYVQRVRQWLSGFRYLSCREKRGAHEITRVTGRECEWLIDPTLYLSPEQWKTKLSLQSIGGLPYVFVFFLDGMSGELHDQIREYAAGKYSIIDPSDPHSKYYDIDPADFLELLSNAHMVFTDSFHVTAFSINFHVPFYVFPRNIVRNMTSRIESICETFCLTNRYIKIQNSFDILESCNFEAADQQLAVERQKFSEYLDKCFGQRLKGII